MWNIILLLLAASIIGAAKRRRRNMSRYISGNIDIDMNVGALLSKTGVGAITNAVVDTTRCSSIRCTYSLSDRTPGADQGPISIYVAHSDYTAAEIEAWIKSAGSWDIGDKIAKEIRSRLIRQIGVFEQASSASLAVTLNDGKPITTKLNWLLAEGDSLKMFVFNQGTVQLNATTVGNAKIFGKANLWQV